MGRGRRFRRGNRRPDKADYSKKEGGQPNRDNRASFKEIERRNADFEAYYKKQGIVPEGEWDNFMTSLATDLPAAFRISSCSKAEANALLDVVEGKYFNELMKDSSGNESSSKPICLPWYPRRLGWHLQITRKDIRRSESYFRLHNFLIAETASGNISRQEVVSMIPPLVLDVQPHHKVLDMCAAPGSKTSQLIELMHSDEEKLPDGLVIANDVDNNRCYMLVHQAKRLNSPGVIVTNHDASIMPNFFTSRGGGSEIMKFDRILCDVPCSGDGTLRKNADIWLKWNAANADNLHGVQMRIIRRGVEMLAIGGRIVYSTCSFNPIEDEAVIHRLISESEGAVELIDVRSQLPGLKLCPGTSEWFPASKDMHIYNSFDEVPDEWRCQVRPQMFPPSKENAPSFHLDKCLRILPHHQDTGGFFVAVMKKVKNLPWESNGKDDKKCSDVTDIDESRSGSDVKTNGPEKKKRKIQGYKEDPYVFLQESEPVWPSIRAFYDLDPSILTGLLTRCAVGKKKNIYFVCPSVRDIAENNHSRIKMINTGVRAFVRCENKDKEGEDKCSFRLAQEGLASILSYIGLKRRVNVTKEDLLTLLSNNDPRSPPEMSLFDPKTQEQVQKLSHGSFVLQYKDEETGLNIDLVGWRGVRTMRAYIALPDCVHYLRLLGGDTSKFDINKFKKDEENSAVKDEVKTDAVESSEEKEEELLIANG